MVTEIFTVWILLRSAAGKTHYFLVIVVRPIGYRWIFSSCGIGFISPTLCRLKMGTTCGRIDGDFSSPMKYGTIASRPGILSNYQTFRLLLILCINKNCCKPFLRSLNCWRAVRFPFQFCQHRLQRISIVNQFRRRAGALWRWLAHCSSHAIFLSSTLQKALLCSTLTAEEIPLSSSFPLPTIPWVLFCIRKVR